MKIDQSLIKEIDTNPEDCAKKLLEYFIGICDDVSSINNLYFEDGYDNEAFIEFVNNQYDNVSLRFEDSWGSEGDGAGMYEVFTFTINEKDYSFLRNGYYSSYDCSEWDENLTLVKKYDVKVDKWLSDSEKTDYHIL